MISPTPSDIPRPDPKIISRIQKLLALSTSNFQGEAESALLKAQKLMFLHGLAGEDINPAIASHEGVTEKEVQHSQTPLWHGKVAVILASNFRCESMWRIQVKGAKRIRIMTFIGFEQDAEIVAAAYSFAIALVNYNMRCIKKRFPRVTRAYLNTYIAGFIRGLRDKFIEQVKMEAWGLILVTPAAVTERLASHNPKEIKPRGQEAKLSKNTNAYAQGYLDGKTFDPDRKRISR